MLRPEQIQTAKRLGLMSSSNMKKIASTESAVKMYGADEVYQMSPTKALLDSGVPVAIEADDPENYWPMWNIEKFVTRQDDKGKVWNPSQRVTRREALYMYTRGCSRYTGDEKTLAQVRHENGDGGSFGVVHRCKSFPLNPASIDW